MDRKDFFSKVLVGGSVLFLAPAVFNSCSKTSDPTPGIGGSLSGPTVIDLSTNAFISLNTVGGYAYSGNIIIIRASTTNYIAMSKLCTHQGCTVTYNKSGNKLICPCHGAAFNTSGSVLQGPASRPLSLYTVTVDGNTLTIG
ncbi:MAG TPA: ubiquinol-cytochrome c reductase iron-sulfur subunit [Prolixibacteraceae bacterium]|nr:ubiquinol-cytochrome c reductase iron-sulfur subunit [Prolixibacteraceae bacterium]